jgi:hypothetical protein
MGARFDQWSENGGLVRLIVYDWHGVQPGTLSWVFPSVLAALAAAEAMKNAVRWRIVKSSEPASSGSEEELRAAGIVLIEQTG